MPERYGQNDNMPSLAPCDVVVGIDAGGSRTRARAARQGAVVYEGSGGPGNPLTADSETVRASYRVALAGCPAAARVAACVSGARGQAQREQITGLLAGRFPGADIQVAPDYVAAFLAAPKGTDACVVAGGPPARQPRPGRHLLSVCRPVRPRQPATPHADRWRLPGARR